MPRGRLRKTANKMILPVKRYRVSTFLKVAFIVPLCVFLLVAASGYFFGGSSNSLIGTLISFFLIIPTLNVFLSKVISGNKNLALKSLISLFVFYGIMVFMIYKHYQSDFFKVMMMSLGYNTFILFMWMMSTWFDRRKIRRIAEL